MSRTDTTGRCLCGDIRLTIAGELRSPGACHCSQCRRQSGHYWAAATVDDAALTVTGVPRWFEASDKAVRGFCARCGSFLFWKARGSDTIDVALGCLDAPTGVRLERHIFTAHKGDYYDIDGDLPQEARE